MKVNSARGIEVEVVAVREREFLFVQHLHMTDRTALELCFPEDQPSTN